MNGAGQRAAVQVPLEGGGFWRRSILGRLSGIREGRLTVSDGTGEYRFGPDDQEDLRVRVQVHDDRVYRDLAIGGSLGAAEAFMRGEWTTDNLCGLVRLWIRNRDVLDEFESGLATVARPARKFFHWLHRNTPLGSRRNIHAHYDLGNEFFQLFLDETMMYSSAVFPEAGSELREASEAKLELICRKLDLGPDDHVLEIGSGWGGFAIHAANNYGCRVTSVTISGEQLQLARKRVEDAGLKDRIEIRMQDYREIPGQFDKLVSIEMIEAVGHQFLDTFFAKCGELLKPGGMMLLQAITIAEQNYERTRREVDFIKRYIFPGGSLPSVTAMMGSVSRATDMRLLHLEDIAPHYARTLRIWWDRFAMNRETIRALGYPEEFLRRWEYYLRYCEGGFIERAIGDVQMVLARPECKHEVRSDGVISQPI